MNTVLECCVDSVESAVIATENGANRLELCSNLIIGGTTPTRAVYEAVRRCCNNKIHVLIRPRFGDFCYSDIENEIILEEVRQYAMLGADGVVVGTLTEDGLLNRLQMEKIVSVAGDMRVALHRAIDVSKDVTKTARTARELGITTILTSGGKNSAYEGRDVIKKLIELVGDDVEIMAGAGINANMIEQLYDYTACRSYHMSGKIVINSRMKYRNQGVHMGLPSMSEYDIWQTAADNVRMAREYLDSRKI